MIRQVSPWLGVEEEAAVAEVIRSGWLTEGPKCEEFKVRLLKLIGAPYGVFAPNGTIALALAMMALGIGEGDQVVVPNLTMAASAFAVMLTGAMPVFVDVDEHTLQMDAQRAFNALAHQSRRRTIMPVHLFGNSVDFSKFDFTDNIFTVEDACQAIGVRAIDGTHAGNFGHVACFSFFADKTITTGEGGFVTCHDERTYDRLRLLRNQGRIQSGSFVHPAIGFNFRITEMQAAIGICQLNRLNEIIVKKQQWLTRYIWALDGMANLRVLYAKVPFRCVIFCDEAADLMAHLRANGVEPRGMFAPLHSQPCFKGVLPERSDEEFPISIAAHKRGLMLPLRPTLTEQEFDHIVKTVRSFYGR